jgi:ribosomal protein S18 acetylase RimI-like enzyme
MNMPESIQPASDFYFSDLQDFIHGPQLIFQHLDWLKPSERLREPGCFVLNENGEFKAIISCTPERLPAAWIRFFITRRDGSHADAFAQLLAVCIQDLRSRGVSHLYALPMPEWFFRLVSEAGFSKLDELVSLSLDRISAPPLTAVNGLRIRPMFEPDLPAVEALDSAAFEPAWQINLQSITHTFSNSAINLTAWKDGHLSGYLMAGTSGDHAHLVRLAVVPSSQHMGIGRALLNQLLQELADQKVQSLSVNTHASNEASLGLYTSSGFKEVGSRYPVCALMLEASAEN